MAGAWSRAAARALRNVASRPAAPSFRASGSAAASAERATAQRYLFASPGTAAGSTTVGAGRTASTRGCVHRDLWDAGTPLAPSGFLSFTRSPRSPLRIWEVKGGRGRPLTSITPRVSRLVVRFASDGSLVYCSDGAAPPGPCGPWTHARAQMMTVHNYSGGA